MNTNTPTPHDLLEQARELGARVGALNSLGAGITAALAQNALDPDHIYLLIEGYVANLVTLSTRIETGLAAMTAAAAQHADAVSSPRDRLPPERGVELRRDIRSPRMSAG